MRHELLLAGADEDAEALEAELARRAAGRLRRARDARQAARGSGAGSPRGPCRRADPLRRHDRRARPAHPRQACRRRRCGAHPRRCSSGRSHRVITAVAVAASGQRRGSLASVSRVRFAPLTRGADRAPTSPAASRSARPAPMRSRARAAAWIERIEGSYTGIMGLPLHETAALLALGGRRGPAVDETQSHRPRCKTSSSTGHRRKRASPSSRTARCRSCTSSATLERGRVGNIYTGKVARVLPGMQSAFIDIGLERAAFLHIADVHVGSGTSRNDHSPGAVPPPPIERLDLRGPDAHRAGDQGPDRHQGRAAVDADLDRRAPARLPAAGRAHRHLAEDRLAGAARAAARAHDRARRRPRTTPRAEAGEARPAAASSCAPTPPRRATTSSPTTSRYLTNDLERGARARLQVAAGNAAAPGPEPGRARAARPGRRAHADDPDRLADAVRGARRSSAASSRPSAVGKLQHYAGERPIFDLFIDRRGDRQGAAASGSS